MKFGMFYELQMPRPWTDTAEYDTLWDAVRQVQYAEEMGFERVWLVEHHFLTEFAHSSAPEVMLAVMAQHTKKMRLGFGVVLAPVHHPAARGGAGVDAGHSERRAGGCRRRADQGAVPTDAVRDGRGDDAEHDGGDAGVPAADVVRRGVQPRR